MAVVFAAFGHAVWHSADAAAADPNLVADGGFEQQVIEGGSVPFSGPGVVGGWQLEGTVDLVADDYWQPADGRQSLDMSGTCGPGLIYQEIETVPGFQYAVSFSMAGNPEGPPTTKALRVHFGGDTTVDFSFDATSTSRSTMGWVEQRFLARADTTATRITFESLEPGCYGPTIDAVSVTETAPPSGFVPFRKNTRLYVEQGPCDRIPPPEQTHCTAYNRDHWDFVDQSHDPRKTLRLEVVSATVGVVRMARNDVPDGTDPDGCGAGNYVVVENDSGAFVIYGHLRQGSVVPDEGDRVALGSSIGSVGYSGRVTGPHLHFGWMASMGTACPWGSSIPGAFLGLATPVPRTGDSIKSNNPGKGK